MRESKIICAGCKVGECDGGEKLHRLSVERLPHGTCGTHGASSAIGAVPAEALDGSEALFGEGENVTYTEGGGVAYEPVASVLSALCFDNAVPDQDACDLLEILGADFLLFGYFGERG